PHITTYGSAKINVNTAPRQVLQTIAAEMDQESAETIIRARQSQPFTAIAQLKDLPGLETVYGFIYLYLDVKSSRYQIEATAFVNDGRRTIRASVAKDS
ncbi:MAG: general secretion pathway protein GspK, partial [Desulfuromonadales bacterium]|nr:general secretion pathway protein GspK [Desulfuromonadales bacterium]